MRTMNLNFVKFAACRLMVAGLSASALASSRRFLAAMVAGLFPTSSILTDTANSDRLGITPRRSSIVGLGTSVHGRR
jgi:hypothetical protein